MIVTADFGNGPQEVSIENPVGVGNDRSFHIGIDRFYQGRVWLTTFGWQHDIHRSSILEMADIIAIVEMLGGDWFKD